MRVGGKAGRFEGFTHTRKEVDSLQVEDELKQVDESAIDAGGRLGQHSGCLQNVGYIW